MNDQDLERVLKSAGLREKPPAEVERELREHLRKEWRSVVAERGRRHRQRTYVALAASIVAVAVAVWALAPRFAEPGDVVATVALATGDMRVTSGWLDTWHGVTGGQDLRAGQTLETGATGRGALALPGGISARVDHGSRLVVAAADRLVLDRGTLYVDSGSSPAPAVPLDVVTPTGTVRHVGTQYEVRLLDTSVQVSVRDGTIEWRSRRGDVEHSGSGEQLTITSDGRVERTSVPAYGAAWDWTLEAAPTIDIEGLPLAQFLAWAARETGRAVVYASPQAEAEAAGIVVHGSIAGLTPAEALDAVLATTSVHANASGGDLVVESR
jgi:ferric-dicitrate binding protein FerR (iron transport regulator)